MTKLEISEVRNRLVTYLGGKPIADIKLRQVSGFLMHEFAKEKGKKNRSQILYRSIEDVEPLLKDTLQIVTGKSMHLKTYRNTISVSGYEALQFKIIKKEFEFNDGPALMPMICEIVLPKGKMDNLDILMSSFKNQEPIYYEKTKRSIKKSFYDSKTPDSVSQEDDVELIVKFYSKIGSLNLKLNEFIDVIKIYDQLSDEAKISIKENKK